MLRFLSASLGADKSRSFALGASRADVDVFVMRALAERPDVLIIDQHLEYGDETTPEVGLADGIPPGSVLGTDVARELRQKGFDNCIVLHSANDLLSETYDDALFDGFLAKRVLTKDHVERVMSDALERRHGHGGVLAAGAAAPISTPVGAGGGGSPRAWGDSIVSGGSTSEDVSGSLHS